LHSTSGPPDPLEPLLARGVELQRLGRHAEALDAFREGLAMEPGHPVAHLLAGMSSLHLGRWEMGVAHAHVAAAANPHDAAAWCNLALGQRELGRSKEAGYAARTAITVGPRLANAWIAMGLVQQDAGSPDEARASFARAIELDPNLASAPLALGNLERSQGRVDAALAAYAKAQSLDPGLAEVHYNRGHLAHTVTGDIPAAIASYREAVAMRPGYAMAHHNLASALFLAGDFAAAWNEYRWRPPRLQFEERAPYEPPGAVPPPGSRLMIVAEQGLGDVLFFLRFAARLRDRGVALEFRGDRRLEGMLVRTGIFDRVSSAADDGRDPEVARVLAGDLPLLFAATERGEAPPPLALTADPERLAIARARLAAAGPPPYIGLAWRAGRAKTGPEEALLKELPLPAFGSALKETRATWISLQREPRAGERERLASHLGAPVHDFSAVNADLEDCLAFMAAIDDFAGVSNTNVHFRAGCGRGGHILVPFPYEWRWMAAGASRWFPAMRVQRQAVDGSWDDAFAQLARGLA
jgi:tetratricopeptide (TPR) repeat protein